MPSPDSATNVHDYTLPTRRTSDILIQRYWARVHPIYPFLDRDDFENCYQSIWMSKFESSGRRYHKRGHPASPNVALVDSVDSDGGRPDARIFYCLLNLVFALACLYDDPESSNGPQDAVMFWRRCKHLLQLDLDVFNKGSLQLVQVMLLTGLYLRAIEFTGGCWNITGNALRLAQGLGLHLPPSLANRYRKPESQPYEMNNAATRWRVWSGCLLMDRLVIMLCIFLEHADVKPTRTVGMTYGRPFMVPLCKLSSLRVPESLRHTIGPIGDAQTAESKTMVFYQNSLQLAEILAKVVSVFYDDELADEDECSSSDQISDDKKLLRAPALIQRIEAGDFKELVSLEASLDRWEQQLPEWLQIPDLDRLLRAQANAQRTYELDAPTTLDRQAVILRTRYDCIFFDLLRRLTLSAVGSSMAVSWRFAHFCCTS